MKTIRILDISILNVTLTEAVALLDDAVETREGASIYFVNAECLNVATKDSEYREILGRSEYVFGDGSGVWIASKMIGTRIVDNVNGTDMLPLICELCVERSYSLYLLGAKPGVAERMKERLCLQHDTLDIRGCQDGYFDRATETGRVVATIKDAAPDILLVAFGAPAQEKWIDAHRDELNCPICLGVGGLFDFYSGGKPRAPLWMRKSGIEWMHRMVYDPLRLWKRYLLGNPMFFVAGDAQHV